MSALCGMPNTFRVMCMGMKYIQVNEKFFKSEREIEGWSRETILHTVSKYTCVHVPLNAYMNIVHVVEYRK